MKMRKILALTLALVCLAGVLAGCGSKAGAESKDVVIWTSGEDYKNEFYLSSLKEKFPDYNITLEYMNSSTIAAKVKEEGDKAAVDIICSEEYGYLYMVEDYLATLDDFDYSNFLDDLVPASHKFTPELKNGGCVILNKKVLEAKGVAIPTSYADLLDPQYKDLISMPSPASSGTGYMFLRQLVNEWGEEETFAYFEKLTDNILQYTSSGSGPVNALVQGEVGIGLGMTSQAVVEINEGVELDVVFFEEGSPFSMYGNAVMAKSAERQAVKDVFNYLATDLCKEVNIRYFPDQIYKDFVPEVQNYPQNVKYGNMADDTLEEKERLLSQWSFS